ncbi:MAG: apolipoprotein N-acyltransferase [Verrucomicrobiota bacterium]|nr:apolipoprotein N-acyltransferase [Verrucomicrobiota bacterium]
MSQRFSVRDEDAYRPRGLAALFARKGKDKENAPEDSGDGQQEPTEPQDTKEQPPANPRGASAMEVSHGPQLTRWLMLLAIVLTPLFYTICFPPYGKSTSATFFAVPLLLWLYRSPTFKQTFFIGLYCGTLSWTVLLSWLHNAPYAIGWHPFWAGLLGWSMTIALAAIMGLFWASWVLAARWILPKLIERRMFIRVLGLFGIAGAWVILEWLRTWLFTGFPWLPLAASQWETPLLLQILPYTGAYGLSFLLVFFNLAVAVYLNNLLTRRGGALWQRLCPEFYLALAMFFWVISLAFTPGYFSNRREVLFNAGLVQPNIPQEQKWDEAKAMDALQVLEKYSSIAQHMGADVIVWPESVTPWPVIGTPQMRAWTEELSATLKRPILMGNMAVIGDLRDEKSLWYNGVFVVDPVQGLYADRYYTKRKLVPFGEYVPLHGWLPFIEKLVPIQGSLTPGLSPASVPLDVESHRYYMGALVCFEDVFPGLARDSVQAGADILFVATNNGWFGEEGGAEQHAAHSVLRAAETRRPLLRCGNGGWSGFIDEYGRIRDRMVDKRGKPYFRGAQTVSVSRDPSLAAVITPYVRWGDWLVLLSLGFVLGAWWMLRPVPVEAERRPD